MSVESIITENLDIWTSAIKTKSTSGRGSSNKLELYGIKKLRELILELAIRGKLVPQDLDDEPAAELLLKIETKNNQLVESGKIPKKKKLPPPRKTDLKFEIPNTWTFACLNQLISISSGKNLTSSKMNSEGGVPVFGGNGITGYHDTSNVNKRTLVIGRVGYYCGSIHITPCEAWVTDNAFITTFAEEYIDINFLSLLLNTTNLKENDNATAQPVISGRKIYPIVVPLPPYNEQIRIVTKVTELMALCDQLESQTEASIEAHQTLVKSLLETLTNAKDADELNESWQRISDHFDVLFTTEESIDLLKQTILQLAVMGKLVKQDPNYEPASKLLERIAAEKEQLIKDQIIKKQKPLPPISEDEKPFQLPRGWEWCRLEDVVDIQSGITKGRKLAGKQVTKVAYLSVANVQRGFLKLEQLKEIEIAAEEVAKYEVRVGDLLITEGGDWDKVGRTAIWNGSIPYIAHQNHVFKARKLLGEQNELWLETYLNSPFARDYFAGSSKQTTNLASINKTQLRGCLIAIPPSKHQSEILSSIHSVVELCESLLRKLKSKSKIECSLAELVAHR
ncbi:restriction endonuclease subunit S [Candidatus Enterovibrio escicola]|uniref:restriction endonuclease subunit S n=1 Tax=Candidatus Enterovibrio escicola TaxID=1927127 RepID=UPI0012380769|nr:restriction endonuclease subunit S [Candidatus Enterovibrio escacola]